MTVKYLNTEYDGKLQFYVDDGYDKEVVKEKYPDIIDTADEENVKLKVELMIRGVNTQGRSPEVNSTIYLDKLAKTVVLSVKKKKD